MKEKELTHIWGETEEGYQARVKAHQEALRKKTKLKCLCTPNALCSHCQDVIVLQRIAGRLFTAGDQVRGNITVNLSAEMSDELLESYMERVNEKARSLPL